MTPQDAREVIERLEAGDGAEDVFAALIDAARAFASLVPQWVFRSPSVTGIAYVTENQMMAETMLAARPDAPCVQSWGVPLPGFVNEPIFEAAEEES